MFPQLELYSKRMASVKLLDRLCACQHVTAYQRCVIKYKSNCALVASIATDHSTSSADII